MVKSVIEYLREISLSDTSSIENENFIKNLLLKMGFNQVKVLYGIVYLEGIGKPESLNQIALYLLKIFEEKTLKEKT